MLVIACFRGKMTIFLYTFAAALRWLAIHLLAGHMTMRRSWRSCDSAIPGSGFSLLFPILSAKLSRNSPFFPVSLPIRSWSFYVHYLNYDCFIQYILKRHNVLSTFADKANRCYRLQCRDYFFRRFITVTLHSIIFSAKYLLTDPLPFNAMEPSELELETTGSVCFSGFRITFFFS